MALTISDPGLAASLADLYKSFHSTMSTMTPLATAMQKKLADEEEARNEALRKVGAHYGVAAQRGRPVVRAYVECGGRKWYYDPSGTIMETSE